MLKKILLILLILIVLSGSLLYLLFYYHKLPDLIILDYKENKIDMSGKNCDSPDPIDCRSILDFFQPQILIKNIGNGIADIRNISIKLGNSGEGRARANKPFILPGQTATLEYPGGIGSMPNDSIISINDKNEYIKQIKESNYQNNAIIIQRSLINK